MHPIRRLFAARISVRLITLVILVAILLVPSPATAAARQKKGAVTVTRGKAGKRAVESAAERAEILSKLRELVGNGQGEHALPVLNRRLALTPDDPELLILRSAVFQAAGKNAEALADARRAVAAAAGNAEAQAQLGTLLAQAGQLADARGALAAAVGLAPDNLRARLSLALCRKLLGDPQGALAEFDEAIRRRPDSPDALLERARLKQQQGDLSGAEDDLRAAARALPPGLDGSIREKIDALAAERARVGDGSPFTPGTARATAADVPATRRPVPEVAAATTAAGPAVPAVPPVPAASPFVPPAGTVTPLVTAEVAPSATDQSVRIDGRLSITLPPGLVTKPEKLVVDRVTPAGLPQDPTLQFKSLDRLQISLGEQHQLKQPVRVDYVYDAKALVPGVEPWEQLVAMRYDEARQRWYPLPVEAGPRPGTVSFQTDHLS
ncbi:MAG TPA: tetratricopeptide repeat protein, partial [Candidatus Aminicenantes bacterium]|nr:tetratricopeptide repeat protein [Candidatus Aminicenantes bacterium]